MSFIEGIGDEVVLCFVIVFVFVLAALITFIGSVPPVGSVVVGRYERDSPEHGENSVSSNLSRVPLRRFADESPQVIHSNSFTIEGTVEQIIHEVNSDEDIPHDAEAVAGDENETLRTEADGSSVQDVNRVVRTEADGSAVEDVSSTTVENHQGATAPPSENVEAQEELAEPAPGEIRVRLKYLDDTERVVTTNPSTKIGDFKKSHFRENLRDNKVVRLIFAGRLLQDHITVENCRIVDNSVVHVQVLAAPTAQTAPTTSQDTDLDVGRLLIPAITVILGVCWVTYSKHPEYFSTLSLGILMFLSGFFFYFAYQTRR